MVMGRFIQLDYYTHYSILPLLYHSNYCYCVNSPILYGDQIGYYPTVTAIGYASELNIGYSCIDIRGICFDTLGNVATFESRVGLPTFDWGFKNNDYYGVGMFGASYTLFYQVGRGTIKDLDKAGCYTGFSVDTLASFGVDFVSYGKTLDEINEGTQFDGIQLSVGVGVGFGYSHLGNTYTKLSIIRDADKEKSVVAGYSLRYNTKVYANPHIVFMVK